MNIDDAKKAAALAALDELPDAGVIGLGTGSTAKHFIDGVGALVRAGRKLRGVPTSEASRAQAEALGIPLVGDDEAWDIAVTVDGADEIDPSLDLIKGGGGAHTREKVVNHASRKNVIIADGSKLVAALGERMALPVEVLRFGHATTARHLRALGEPVLRTRNGAPFVTDAGNLVYDVRTGPIGDAAALDRTLRALPGVVETGLFLRRASLVLIADPAGVRRMLPPGASG